MTGGLKGLLGGLFNLKKEAAQSYYIKGTATITLEKPLLTEKQKLL